MDPLLSQVLKALIVALFAVIAVAANPLIRWILAKIDQPTPKQDDDRLLEPQRVLPGGRWIGMLERVATYSTLMAGFPAGLAMIVAVKGLGRYPELHAQSSPRIGELFIIGTMLSMLWAAGCAGLAYWLIRLW